MAVAWAQVGASFFLPNQSFFTLSPAQQPAPHRRNGEGRSAFYLVGIPVIYLGLLWFYRIPHIAQELQDAAYLQLLVQEAMETRQLTREDTYNYFQRARFTRSSRALPHALNAPAVQQPPTARTHHTLLLLLPDASSQHAAQRVHKRW